MATMANDGSRALKPYWTPIRIQLPPTYPEAPPLVLANVDEARKSNMVLATTEARAGTPHPYLLQGTPIFTCDDLKNWRGTCTLAELFSMYIQTGFDTEPVFFAAQTPCPTCHKSDHRPELCPFVVQQEQPRITGAGAFFPPPPVFTGGGAPPPLAPASPPGFSHGGGALFAGGAGGGPQRDDGDADADVKRQFLERLSAALTSEFLARREAAQQSMGRASQEFARLAAEGAACRAAASLLEARLAEACAVRAEAEARGARSREWCDATAPVLARQPAAAAEALRPTSRRAAQLLELLAARSAHADANALLSARLCAPARGAAPSCAAAFALLSLFQKNAAEGFLVKRRVEALAADMGVDAEEEAAPVQGGATAARATTPDPLLRAAQAPPPPAAPAQRPPHGAPPLPPKADKPAAGFLGGLFGKR